MVSPDDFQARVGEVGAALTPFLDGDAEPVKAYWSRRSPVSILGGWGAYETGWAEVGPRLEWAAARFAGGRTTQEVLVSEVSGDLGYTVSLERGEARVAGRSDVVPMTLRVTHVYRREDGEWLLVHRHADPLTEKTAPAAVLQPPTD